MDFRLFVFLTIIKNNSFTKAAQELCISQPAVSKHVKELEKHYNTHLILRKGQSIHLTDTGQILFQHALKMEKEQQALEFDISQNQNQTKGQIKLGASSTISQYFLPKILAAFKREHESIQISLRSGNTNEIEQMLDAYEIDFALVEGAQRKTSYAYEYIYTDKIVPVVSMHSPLFFAEQNNISFKDVIKQDIVLREEGSGTREVVLNSLLSIGANTNDINNNTTLGSTEAIKSFLRNSDSLGFLSQLSFGGSQSLKPISIKKLNIERDFNLIYFKGLPPTGLGLKFIKFLKQFNTNS
ncbi:LysR substrate-binding domain-containing protein [Aureibacter tunicatorum]|uniref:DNA-binding transcriptional LysR family regulator n=1 Tax=Aureibacter tunicatorum TaxID=866807 RepID=A0AAE3XP42_9BACT|nr:LysR substrate-binding domain-containing protein [Aureibacter tunicatorum]MDR6240022.1 DNA-binding transcriptional LysR family regulator [Aureibacter tunicatorum]BDD04494.1 transcriptional regulator [Aureibacter tunicatorum]